MKKTFFGTLLIFTILVLLTACGNSTKKESQQNEDETKTNLSQNDNSEKKSNDDIITIKVATGGQDTLPCYATLLDVIKDIEEKADGRVKIEYYGARQLGDDAEILEQVMSGMVEIGGGGTATFSKFTPLMDVFQMPFLLNDYEKERKAVVSPEAQAIYDKVEEDLGVKVLAPYDAGMRHMANNIKPILTVEDMKGLKMRVVPSNMLQDAFTAIGANPTPMAYGDVYTGLQNKVIDGEEINITSIYSEKHYEVLKHFTEIGLYPFTTAIYINADFFNSLDKDIQDIITECFKNGYSYNFDKYIPAAEEIGKKAMIEAGISIDTIADIKPFQNKIQNVMNEYKTKDPLIANFIDMALELE